METLMSTQACGNMSQNRGEEAFRAKGCVGSYLLSSERVTNPFPASVSASVRMLTELGPGTPTRHRKAQARTLTVWRPWVSGLQQTPCWSCGSSKSAFCHTSRRLRSTQFHHVLCVSSSKRPSRTALQGRWLHLSFGDLETQSDISSVCRRVAICINMCMCFI